MARIIMSSTSTLAAPACNLESIIATGELAKRPSRAPDRESEDRALLFLTHELAKSPRSFFATLVKLAIQLSGADSTGISLLNRAEGRFVWPAVAGKLDSYVGSGTPSDFGPCGTVLDLRSTLLLSRPERHFTYLKEIRLPLEEVLLVPFYVDGEPVGTIWAVIHEPDRKFDAEDRRLLESLSTFAGAAYRTLSAIGALEPMLWMKPA